MRCLNPVVKTVAAFVLLALVITPTYADKIPIRGGSTYGDNTGFSGCVSNITDFINTSNANNCEGFIAGTFTIGGNSYSGALFAFLEPGGSAFGTLDIIELAGNSSLALTLLNPDPTGPTGAFLCGSFGPVDPPPVVAQDSTPANMTGLPCTPGSSSGGYFNASQDLANVQANFSATGVTFVNGNATALTIFTADGNIDGATFAPGGTTSTPEPASLILLGTGAGLLALRRKFCR
jgi:PEP-CTERM motif